MKIQRDALAAKRHMYHINDASLSRRREGARSDYACEEIYKVSIQPGRLVIYLSMNKAIILLFRFFLSGRTWTRCKSSKSQKKSESEKPYGAGTTYTIVTSISKKGDKVHIEGQMTEMEKEFHLFTFKMQLASMVRQIAMLLNGVAAMNLNVLSDQCYVLEEV